MAIPISENKKLALAIKKQLENMIQLHPIVDSSVVVTSDGYVVAKLEHPNYSLERVGTMGSSMVSLADTMTAELSMGNCKNLVIENDLGLVVMVHINTNLSIVTITHDPSKLGMLLSATKVCADAIKKTVK